MRFTDSFLDEIRGRLPISEVVGARVTFDKKKTNRGRGDYWACCPFHGEKTPSFHCEDRKGRYHCFGCGASGDHFRFLVELDGLSFPEAVERLADKAGLPMPVMDKREQEREEKRATLFDVMELASQFYRDQLQSPAGAPARAYLRERGLSSAVQQEFGIGFAPDSRNALKEFLASKNISHDQMIACGLLIHGDDIPVSYDRFRGRIMFPIPDARGRVIAFGGRALNPDVPAKYLNSPETELFHKSNVLYNFLRARKTAHDKQQIIATEGYMDVIAMHASGFANCVAPLGTALTERQMTLLWRIHSEPILCFDGDDAGLKAAYRAIDMVLPGLQGGKSVRFAMLPEGLDPDDLLRAEGPQAMQEVLDSALPLADMVWNRETANGVYETPEKRAELEGRVRRVTSQIRDESLRRHYDQNMRERLAVFFGNRHGGDITAQPGERYGRNDKFASGSGRRFEKPWKKGVAGRVGATPSLLNSSLVKKRSAMVPLREAALVMGVVNHPAILNRFFDEFSHLPLQAAQSERMRQKIIDAFAMHAQDEQPLAAERLREILAEDGLLDILESMERQLKQNRIWQTDIESGFEDAVDGWRQAYALHLKNHTLHRELKAAEMALANDDSEENLERLLLIQTELANDDGMEALIDGFGLSSGRPTKGF